MPVGVEGSGVNTVRRSLWLLTCVVLVAGASPPSASTAMRPHHGRAQQVLNGRIVFGRWSSAASSDIFTIRPNGTGMKRLTSDGSGWYPAWSRDGRRIAFTGRKNSIWIMNASGRRPHRITRSGRSVDLRPTWSPDGSRIAFDRMGSTTPPTVIYVVHTDGSHLRRLRGGNDAAWSPDGKLIAFTKVSHGISLMRPNGRDAHRIVSGDAMQPSWSPDGQRLAFALPSSPSRNWDIWLVETDGSGLRRLTVSKALDQMPAWSPDGRRIAFQRGGAIWTIGANGKGARKLTHPGKGADADPDWRALRR
jgi:Tol biopolymer transport system component